MNEKSSERVLSGTYVVTDQNGNQKARMAFDAFGNRLQNHFASAQSIGGDSQSYKGYTGHDQLDELGLIHMGGRVYDPGVGRFLSADLFVQAPNNSQSYNRYSYVLNNPLSLVDPHGYRSTSKEDEAKKAPEETVTYGYRNDAARAAQRAASCGRCCRVCFHEQLCVLSISRR
ncbi:MAG TPA: RHS repeat-associated core domain-containing protein [Marinagarivorans sp.]